MKNNIIIAGVPRAGKSTVSHILSQEYGYQHVSMDSIIAGFEKCFPETGVSTYQGLSSLDTLRVIKFHVDVTDLFLAVDIVLIHFRKSSHATITCTTDVAD